MPLDETDRRILDLLQRDADLSLAEIAERVGLSPTPCWRRIRKLDESRVIRARVALLDHEQLGVGTMVFVRLRAAHHSFRWLERLKEAIAGMDEVVGFYRLSGEVDYLLQVVVPDIAGYDSVYKRLVGAVELDDVSASFVMEVIKSTTALPLAYVPKRP